MNTVNIFRREHKGAEKPVDHKLGVVTAFPPNHAYTEAYDDYTRRGGQMDFKIFKAGFKPVSPETKILVLPGLNIDYILVKEKV